MAGLRQLKKSLVTPQPRRIPMTRLILVIMICLLGSYVFGTFYINYVVDKYYKAIECPRVVPKRDVLQSDTLLVRVEFQPTYVIPKYALVVEKAQNVVYKPVNVSSQIKSAQKVQLKKLAWLNPPGWMTVKPYKDFTQCAVSDCVISFNRSDVDGADLVLVEGNAIPDAETPTTNPDQIWVFYTAETVQQFYNPRSYRRKDWIGRFNWTMTYRLDSDIVSSYSRLILKDGFVDTANYTDIVLRKTRSVLWFVSHCDTQSKRKEYVEELRKYIDVDIYGKCGNLTCEGQQCDNLWNKYWFYLSFENSMCKDYVTEKFFNTFNKRIVPVVRGGADYRTLFPPDLYINTADFPSPRALAEHLKALQHDLPGYTKILRNMAKYEQGGNFLKGVPCICDICAKLHQPLVRKNYFDMHRWLTEGICFKPKDI